MSGVSFSVQIGSDTPVRIGFDRGAGVLVVNLLVKLWTVGPRRGSARSERDACRRRPAPDAPLEGAHPCCWRARSGDGQRRRGRPAELRGEIASFEVEHPGEEPGLRAWPARPTSVGTGWRLEATTATGQTLHLDAEREGEKVGVMVTARVPSNGGATVSELRAYATDGTALTEYRPVVMTDGATVAFTLRAAPSAEGRG